MTTATIEISGMTCGHCVAAVERALRGETGVQEASVDLNSAAAQVRYDEGQTRPEALLRAVEGQGYTAKLADSRTATDS